MALPHPERPLKGAQRTTVLASPKQPESAPPNLLWAALLLAASAAAVLLCTRALPAFESLGPRGALFGWLAAATAITALLPAIVTFQILGVPKSRAGLGPGRSRRDAVWIVVLLLLAIATGAILSHFPAVRAYYPRYAPVKEHPILWLPSTLAFAAYGLAWETLFRGHLLLALHREGDSRRRTAALLALQTAIFATGHLDKPPVEAWLSIPAGLFFGALALRTRSVWPGFLLHFAASTSVNLFCAYGGSA